MKNYVQPGSSMNFVAPSGGVVSGGFYSFNGLICCAAADAAEGATFAGKICGVYTVTKAGSQAWGHGVAVYLLSGSATTFTTSSGGNTLAGKAAGVVGGGAGETTGLVLLNGLPDTSL